MKLTSTLTTIALATLVPAAASVAGPFEPKRVPEDAKWVIHIDADAAKASKVGRTIVDELKGRPMAMEKLGEVEAFTGFKVPEDVRGVTIYGRQLGEDNNVVLIDGKFDRNRILAALEMGPSFASEAYGKDEVVSWDDKGRTMFGSFHTGELAIVGRSADNVKAAIDVLEAKRPAMKEAAGAPSARGAGVMVYVAGEGLNELAKQPGASPMLRNTQSAWLVLGEDATSNVFAKGHVESADDQQSDRLYKAAEGIRAIVSLRASQENADAQTKALDEMLQSLKLTRGSNGIDLDWQTPADTLIAVVKAQLMKPEAMKN